MREKFSDYVGRSAKVLSSLAAAQVGSLVGGPGGVVAAELLTSVAKDAIESFTEKKVNPNFKYAKGDWVIVDRGHNHILSKKWDARSTVYNLDKDVGMAVKLAGKLGVKATVSKNASRFLNKAIKNGMAQKDFSLLYRDFDKLQKL